MLISNPEENSGDYPMAGASSLKFISESVACIFEPLRGQKVLICESCLTKRKNQVIAGEEYWTEKGCISRPISV